MGCASSKVEEFPMVRLPTVNGVLKVTVTNAKIEHETSSMFAMDPYFKIRVSNQEVISKTIPKGGKEPVFNESFEFFINSCYQRNGRHLELELWDASKTGDSLIGFGMMDLDPILVVSKDPKDSKEKKTKAMRILLNYDIKPAGIINVEFDFVQHPIELLNFRFETISIRRKTSSTPDCYVKVTIGEQVLKTKRKKDTLEMPPVWKDEVLTLNVPKIIKNCLIEVYDDDEIVGESVLKVEDLMKEVKEKQYDEDVFYKEGIAGTLRFQTMVGEKVEFSELKRDYKRKVEVKKQEVINPEVKDGEKGKEGEKKDDKKDDKLKEGEKGKQAEKGKVETDRPKEQVKKYDAERLV